MDTAAPPKRVAAIAATFLLVACGGSCTDGKGGETRSDAAAIGDSGAANDAAETLPASLKGYELYAWDEGEVLWFTLVTGTNRMKTLAEITQKNVDMRRDDFIVINSSGWDALQGILAIVPRGTPVILASGLDGLPPLGEVSRTRIEQMLRALGV